MEKNIVSTVPTPEIQAPQSTLKSVIETSIIYVIRTLGINSTDAELIVSLWRDADIRADSYKDKLAKFKIILAINFGQTTAMTFFSTLRAQFKVLNSQSTANNIARNIPPVETASPTVPDMMQSSQDMKTILCLAVQNGDFLMIEANKVFEVWQESFKKGQFISLHGKVELFKTLIGRKYGPKSVHILQKISERAHEIRISRNKTKNIVNSSSQHQQQSNDSFNSSLTSFNYLLHKSNDQLNNTALSAVRVPILPQQHHEQSLSTVALPQNISGNREQPQISQPNKNHSINTTPIFPFKTNQVFKTRFSSNVPGINRPQQKELGPKNQTNSVTKSPMSSAPVNPQQACRQAKESVLSLQLHTTDNGLRLQQKPQKPTENLSNLTSSMSSAPVNPQQSCRQAKKRFLSLPLHTTDNGLRLQQKPQKPTENLSNLTSSMSSVPVTLQQASQHPRVGVSMVSCSAVDISRPQEHQNSQRGKNSFHSVNPMHSTRQEDSLQTNNIYTASPKSFSDDMPQQKKLNTIENQSNTRITPSTITPSTIMPVNPLKVFQKKQTNNSCTAAQKIWSTVFGTREQEDIQHNRKIYPALPNTASYTVGPIINQQILQPQAVLSTVFENSQQQQQNLSKGNQSSKYSIVLPVIATSTEQKIVQQVSKSNLALSTKDPEVLQEQQKKTSSNLKQLQEETRKLIKQQHEKLSKATSKKDTSIDEVQEHQQEEKVAENIKDSIQSQKQLESFNFSAKALYPVSFENIVNSSPNSNPLRALKEAKKPEPDTQVTKSSLASSMQILSRKRIFSTFNNGSNIARLVKKKPSEGS